MAVQARTLEIYAKLGIADEALELGRRGNGANMWANGRRMARIPLGEIGKDLSAFPYVLLLGQDDNERIMGARLRTLGVDVQWNTELVAFEQHAGPCRRHAEAAGRHAAQAQRRVGRGLRRGAEPGARAVRHRVSRRAVRAGVLRRRYGSDRAAWCRTSSTSTCGATASTCSFRCAARIAGARSASCRSTCGIATTSPSTNWRRRSSPRRARTSRSSRARWFSTYRIHHRAAERFRDRRCFLLGDAAHIHSPAGGQGMNTGLQDAYNLAWKLALVVKGDADARCSTPTSRSAFRSRGGCSTRPTAPSRCSCPTARSRGCCARASSRASRRSR